MGTPMNLEIHPPHEKRLRLLRDELARRHLDGFVVPLSDEHLSEYVGAYAQRLAWLTGFNGSAGTAVVLGSTAAIFVDSRYTLQVREEVDARDWTPLALAQTNPTAWLREHSPKEASIGFDPWLHGRGWVRATQAALAEQGAKLVPVEHNPIDVIWSDRAAPSAASLLVHREEWAGKSAARKRREVAEWLTSMKADATVLVALDSIAWLFNVRGDDIPNTPVVLAYALVSADGTADLFVAPEKLTEEVIAHLGSDVRLHPKAAFATHLTQLTGRRVAVDPERTPAAALDILEGAGARIIEARDPTVLPKAIKNEVEIAGHEAAQLRDCAAVCRFLHWLANEGSAGNVTELSASAKLEQFRAASGHMRSLSFETISAFGSNAAQIHYLPKPQTNKTLARDGLYLIDSGAQYVDGTTDVARTVAIGAVTSEMRDRYTRILRGLIALTRAVFPVGTRGGQLDILARQYLWAAGVDYAHATGHGVGSFLGVHEGPQRIARSGDCSEPLVPGMIVSNEPGYYKQDAYGIRIENLLLVVKREVPNAEREMLGFQTLSFLPLDRTLIDATLLTSEERAWVDAYHAEVIRRIGPQLEGAVERWLLHAARPLD